MNRDLFLAILAMDSYNRGYGQGLKFFGNSDAQGTMLGKATVSEPRATKNLKKGASTRYPITGTAKL